MKHAIMHPIPGYSTGAFGLTFDLTQADSLRALDKYFDRVEPKTEEAARIRDEWRLWYGGTSAFERNFSLATYDKARTFRTRYMKANAVTTEEKELLKEHLAKAFTAEEAAGEARRMTREGEYPKVPSLVPDLPSFPEATQMVKAIGFAALGIAALILITKARQR